MSKVAAVSVGHRGQNPLTILGGVQLDFGDPRKVFSDLELVLRHRGAKPMKPNLLEKIEVLFGAFSLVRVAGIKNACAVGIPGRATAPGRVLYARDLVGELFAGINLKKMQGSLLAAAFGK